MHLSEALHDFDHTLGPLNSPVTVIEYGDYECPFCAMAQNTVRRLLEEFSPRVCYAYRHFPLSSMHPHAELAALTAEAAEQQGRFWQMHNALFENYDSLSTRKVFTLAEALKMDVDRFELDLERPDLIDRIRRDMLSGHDSGVAGTPTFFVNGMRIPGAANYDTLFKAIDAALARAARPQINSDWAPESRL